MLALFQLLLLKKYHIILTHHLLITCRKKPTRGRGPDVIYLLKDQMIKQHFSLLNSSPKHEEDVQSTVLRGQRTTAKFKVGGI